MLFNEDKIHAENVAVSSMQATLCSKGSREIHVLALFCGILVVLLDNVYDGWAFDHLPSS